MAFHLVLNHPSQLGEVTEAAASGCNPRHTMAEIAAALGAVVHDGTGLPVLWFDKALAKCTGTKPIWWTIARDVHRAVARGDVVFCTGEDVGLPVGLLCGARRGARVACMVHSIDSPKKRAAFRLFGAKRRIALFTAVCQRQAQLLREQLGRTGSRVAFIWDQTDTHFFSPGPSSPDKSRPVVASVGLERRDYATLAAATADLDINVCVSGYSADTRVIASAFPKVMPDNMTRRFYSWVELRQLYRDADVVVVSLFPNDYAAGVQGLMEGLACGRPVIVTRTAGLEPYLKPDEAMRVVKAGDADQMRRAIVDLLSAPAERERIASNGLALARERHTCETYVQTIVENLQALQAGPLI